MIPVVVVAALLTFALISSALQALARASPTDPTHRGSWGVLDWNWSRQRRLDPHERRWETALIGARDQQNRWPDFLAELERVERTADLASDRDPPDQFDGAWIDQRLTALEHHHAAQQQPTSGDPTK